MKKNDKNILLRQIVKDFFNAIFFLSMFALIAYLANYIGVLNNLDNKSVEFINRYSSSQNLEIANFITDLGYGRGISIGMILCLVFMLFKKWYKEGILLSLSVNSAYLLSPILKDYFHRVRPALDYGLITAEGFSFPSGHALVSACFYGILIFIVLQRIKSFFLCYLLAFLLFLTILLISFSRVYLGVHFPSDVLAGMFLGFSINSFWVIFYKLN